MRAPILALTLVFMVSIMPASARAQSCADEPLHKNYNGAGQVTCPCFATGEQAGAIFNVPADHYPIEILRVGVGWGSQGGATPPAFEAAVHIYAGGLPNPGAPIYTLVGPQLTDGVINEYNLEPAPGEITVDSGPFLVALEFATSNSGNFSAASVVHDGDGCQPGMNAIFAVPGGWMDACVAGVTGDWVFTLVYRQTGCEVPIELHSFGDVKSLFGTDE